MALAGTIQFTPVVVQVSELDLVTGTGVTPTGDVGTAFLPMTIANGTGALQATNFVSDNRTLGPGAAEALDFTGGVVDAFGNLVLFTRLVLLMIKASPNNVADVYVKCIGATPIGTLFSDTPAELGVQPGGLVLWASRSSQAYGLISGVSDVLTIVNASAIAPCTYDIVAVGS